MRASLTQPLHTDSKRVMWWRREAARLVCPNPCDAMVTVVDFAVFTVFGVQNQ